MADVKWIKITTDIFDDEKMLLIESMPSADSIITIWFKLLVLSGKQNNNGVFLMNDRIPYTDEMLSTIFRRDIQTVRFALSIFQQFGMIDVIDNVITIPKWCKHQTLDSYEKKKERDRVYQAERRANQKALIKKSSDKSSDVAISDIEEDKDIDKDIYICKNKIPPTVEMVKDYCLERGNGVDAGKFFDFYESKGWMVGKNKMKDWQSAVRTWERSMGFKPKPSTKKKEEPVEAPVDYGWEDD